MKFFIKQLVSKSFFILLTSIFGIYSFHAQMTRSNNVVAVAYYGRPGTSSLGALGQYSIDEVQTQINAKVQEYQAVLPDYKVVPAFDIIYGLATAAPGGDGNYISNLSEDKLMPYINLAQNSNYLVFLELQLGKMTPLEAVKPVLKYLKYKNVNLALDPEFEVYGLDVAPGKVIGHITGDDINQVQGAIVKYLAENNISEQKMLLIHNFTQHMVQNKQDVKFHDQIQIIMNLDGHGSPQLKVNTYNGLYTDMVYKSGVLGGFKLFFKEDHPMMTPKEALGLESVDGVKMREMPRLINYQ